VSCRELKVLGKEPLWKKEQKEHPWATKAEAKRIVKDHAAKKRKK
jgi:hypothetical protein